MLNSVIRSFFLSLPLLISPLYASDLLTVGYGDVVVAQQERHYDASGRCSQIDDPTGTYHLSYDSMGRLSQIFYPNGIETEFIYDSDGHTTGVFHKDERGCCFLSYCYLYDANGKRISKECKKGETSLVTSYQYTSEGYLACMEHPSGELEIYTYNEKGDRLTKETAEGFCDYEYDGDQLIRAGNTSYIYDLAGRLVEKRKGLTSTFFRYQEKGHLASVEGKFGLTTYTYNEKGERVGKSLGSRHTKYGNLEKYDLQDRVRIPLLLEGEEVHYFCYGDGILGSRHSEDQFYYLYDFPDGSIGALVNQCGEIRLWEYEGFGTPRSYLVPIGFNGEWFDLESGFYYLRNRYYDPEIGRFITPDPCDDHPYIYCMNDPVNFVDPIGQWGFGRPGDNSDLMGKSQSKGSSRKDNSSGKSGSSKSSSKDTSSKGPSPSPNSDPLGSSSFSNKAIPTLPPSSKPTESLPTKAQPSLPEQSDVHQPYLTLYSQNPQVQEKPEISKNEAAKSGQSTQPTEKSKGHVMTEVGLSDGTSECRGIYRGEQDPLDDSLRAQQQGTNSITWPVTEEQAQKAMAKQQEDAHYNLFNHNCADRAREVLEAAGIDVPPKDGTVSLPSQVNKWIDHQNKMREKEQEDEGS